MAKEEKIKSCLVIAPIDEEGSEIRQRSNQVLEHIIKPIATECGYKATRADEIAEPGIITAQVIQRLLNDDLVIADLTGKNPNVFYELAVRHAVKKPVIQIIEADELIPFNVAPQRTIRFDHQNLDSVAKCKSEMIEQIKTVEKDPRKVDSPISVAVDLQSLRQSENPIEKSNAEIIIMLQNIQHMMMQMNIEMDTTGQSIKYDAYAIEDLVNNAERVYNNLLKLKDDESSKNAATLRYALGGLFMSIQTVVTRSNLPTKLKNRLVNRTMTLLTIKVPFQTKPYSSE